MSKKCYVDFDGSSKGNPGRAGAGAVLRGEDGSVICRARQGLGNTTNNDAEYSGLKLGMRTALEQGYDRIHVRGDSQLVYKQVQGDWQARHPNMARHCKEATELKNQFKEFKMEHVPRGYNREADTEANKAVNLPPGQVYKEYEDDDDDDDYDDGGGADDDDDDDNDDGGGGGEDDDDDDDDDDDGGGDDDVDGDGDEDVDDDGNGDGDDDGEFDDDDGDRAFDDGDGDFDDGDGDDDDGDDDDGDDDDDDY